MILTLSFTSHRASGSTPRSRLFHAPPLGWDEPRAADQFICTSQVDPAHPLRRSDCAPLLFAQGKTSRRAYLPPLFSGDSPEGRRGYRRMTARAHPLRSFRRTSLEGHCRSDTCRSTSRLSRTLLHRQLHTYLLPRRAISRDTARTPRFLQNAADLFAFEGYDAVISCTLPLMTFLSLRLLRIVDAAAQRQAAWSPDMHLSYSTPALPRTIHTFCAPPIHTRCLLLPLSITVPILRRLSLIRGDIICHSRLLSSPYLNSLISPGSPSLFLWTRFTSWSLTPHRFYLSRPYPRCAFCTLNTRSCALRLGCGSPLVGRHRAPLPAHTLRAAAQRQGGVCVHRFTLLPANSRAPAYALTLRLPLPALVYGIMRAARSLGPRLWKGCI